MDELSMLILNKDMEGIKEFHEKKVSEAYENGFLAGKESVRDAVATAVGLKTGKE